jgi:hypothetical protein
MNMDDQAKSSIAGQHLFGRRGPLRTGQILGHMLQVLDVDQTHLEPGDQNAGHDRIVLLRFLLRQFPHLHPGE